MARKIAVIGTGYVGLVTGVALSEIGHSVTCIDIDEDKIERLKQGEAVIYEEGLEDMLQRNIANGRLKFTTDYQEGLCNKEIVYLGVGTPESDDGSADLTYLKRAAKDIAHQAEQNLIVVTKSTVPVGTNHFIKDYIEDHLTNDIQINIVSNPEFLREGSAVKDTFTGDRIVIGADDPKSAEIMEEVNQGFDVPVYKTDIKSAEMVKYASNAFLATKISFINEISNICEKLGANVEDVAQGMGMDHRVGHAFLNAGIGYGGSCFPKDTSALVQIAGNVEYDFKLLKGVIDVNNHQQASLVDKVLDRLGDLRGKTIAVLGLAFKPNTDDMREAPSIKIINRLLSCGAHIKAYDPIAVDTAKNILSPEVQYFEQMDETLENSDAALILTEWDQIRQFDYKEVHNLMNKPIIMDGRNCLSLEDVKQSGLEYHSMGRPSIQPTKTLEEVN